MTTKRCWNTSVLFATAILTMGLLSACAGDTESTDGALSAIDQQVAELQTQVQQLQAAQQIAMEEQTPGSTGEATLVVIPSIFKFPESRVSNSGDVWFSGSGLKQGQWFIITIHNGGEVGELTDFADDALRQANDDGTFALTLPGIRPDRFQGVPEEWVQQGGAWDVKLWDMDTGALLATTPWLICGQNRENAFCEAAVESALLPEPVVEGSGSVYKIDTWVIEDNLFQLRMGTEHYWGYNAEDRINSTAGDGIVMTVKVGDKILFETLRRSSSRSTKPHRLTIEGLSIDFDAGAVSGEPYEVGPFTEPGEYIIDDSSDPGAHGNAKIIVTE